MGPKTKRAALIVVATLGLPACPTPRMGFHPEELAPRATGSEASVLVGRRVVVRVDPRSDPWYVRVDVFPPGAVLKGAWFRVTTDGVVREGTAPHVHQNGHSFVVRPPGTLFVQTDGSPPKDPDTASVWLGPICLEGDCETLRLGEDDWPRGEP